MASSSGNLSALPWFETPSSHLTPSHLSRQHIDEYVLETIPLSFPSFTDRPHRPPSDIHCFLLGQLEGGFRLPTPLLTLTFYLSTGYL